LYTLRFTLPTSLGQDGHRLRPQGPAAPLAVSVTTGYTAPVALLFIVAILFIRECHSMLNLKSSLWKSSATIALMLGFGASTAHAVPMSATLSHGGGF